MVFFEGPSYSKLKYQYTDMVSLSMLCCLFPSNEEDMMLHTLRFIERFCELWGVLFHCSILFTSVTEHGIVTSAKSSIVVQNYCKKM